MIIVKKYGNRRLYDTRSSAYINLEQLAELIRQGQQVQVQDARTGQDLTREVLLQVVMEVLHGGDLFPASLLHRIIKATGDTPWSRVTYQQLSSGLQLLASQLEQAERLVSPGGMGLPNPFAAWAGGAPPKPVAPPPPPRRAAAPPRSPRRSPRRSLCPRLWTTPRPSSTSCAPSWRISSGCSRARPASSHMEGILAAVEGIVTLLLVGVLLALLARNRRSIASHRRLVASVAGVVFALSIPGVVARAWFVDPRTVLEGAGQGVPFPASFLRTGALLGLLAGLGLQVLHGIWSGLQAGAAAGEWARAAPGRSLFRFEGSRRWHRLGASLLLGAALGALSAPVFQLQGVKAGPDLEQIAATFPGLAAPPKAVPNPGTQAQGGAPPRTPDVPVSGRQLG
ncbi:MAG: polyhydroxyalkanoate synthesis regulator DNA-binding domain-containing protein, partial [Pseudomonadota bacterium]